MISWPRRELAGYVFMVGAVLFAVIRLMAVPSVGLDAQPYPDAQVYADTAVQIARGNGIVTRVDEHRPVAEWRTYQTLGPGRYPPGFSLALAPFAWLDRTEFGGVQMGARLTTISLVLAVAAAAMALGGPVAAAIATIVAATSPFVLTSARLVLSDAFGGLLTIVILVLLVLDERAEGSAGRRAVYLVVAGFVAGYGILTRTSAAFVLAALVLAIRRPRAWSLAGLGALPPLLFLAAFQWAYFGNPFHSGYEYHLPALRMFGLRHVVTENLFGERGFVFNDLLDGALMRWTCPCDHFGPIGKASNLVFYPAVLLGAYWIYFPPLLPLFGLAELYRRRRTWAARFAGLVVVANVALSWPYFYQAGRLVAPAAEVLLVYSAVGLARSVRSFPV